MEPTYESKWCVFQLKVYSHQLGKNIDDREGKGKIAGEIKYDMSRHLNPFEEKSDVKVVNGIEIFKQLPIE